MLATKPRILCVDDEPVNLVLLETLLVPQGYEVIKAGDGRKALDIIEEQKIDLVLLDVMMPEIDGFEICRRIKENEHYRNIPVVIITGLSAKGDRVRGIEAGAEDFISKPIDSSEVFARIRMLLRINELNNRLAAAYHDITSTIRFGQTMLMSFDSLNFDLLTRIEEIVKNILRKTGDMTPKPEIVVVGYVGDNGKWQWYQFDSAPHFLHRTRLDNDLGACLPRPPGDRTLIFHANEEHAIVSYRRFIGHVKSPPLMKIANLAGVLSELFCIVALNYGKTVSQYDAEVLNGIVVQSLYMKSLTAQVRETEIAFDYLVFALARAAEANDEDTGNHILRVGEYCAALSRELGMPEKFSTIIRTQATLHDVGKIHVPPSILKKPGSLTPEEWEIIKQHTVSGVRILGDHVRLALAKKAAMSHHERWDGTGYPFGLKGEQIPIEGRILNIADQYDALRNHRVYKSAFDHATTCKILLEGDGRTMPCHFEPLVLKAFRRIASRFEEIYEKMK